MYQPIQWKNDHILLLDQTRLPEEEVYIECRDLDTVADAIRRLAVRGAPALGVVAAMAVALEARSIQSCSTEEFFQELQKYCERILATRPTAVNMAWSLKRVQENLKGAHCSDISALKKLLEQESLAIFKEDIEAVLIASGDSHKQPVIDAAHAQKHIFVEKPLGENMAEVEEASAAVRRAGAAFGG